eukprot:CAMPEP_0118813220 /NCGR_PEP_ID=MMETSP1162-20130426/2784_1 /TAXON_ID=33656 /ORGANISM="Phaeocystis Sp, Strain CCMP2710" /LENGTH=205 /DNA_ID=CAMNT_0006742989 /DNA_START=40 /DNA_END=654 /DNA_ORIENTATION=+
MAGCMQWFQVTCPTCTAQLQVRLPEGITSVQCSQCKTVFAVQIQPTALDSTQPPGSKRSRKRKAGGDKDPNAVPRALSAYNVFMKQEVARVKAQHVEMAHRDAFKMAAERWQASPMNPQNGGARFPQVEDTRGAGPALEGAEGEEYEGEEDEEEVDNGAPPATPPVAASGPASSAVPPSAPAMAPSQPGGTAGNAASVAAAAAVA